MMAAAPSLAWTPITTDALTRPDTGCYYNVLDHFIENTNDDEVSIVEQLRQTFRREGMLDRLRPARTQSDAKMDEILGLLVAQEQHQQQKRPRGDKNLFLTESYRNGLARTHPLRCFLDTLDRTVRHHLDDFIDLSPRVSVQLAVYPGDGVSGYPRHCDRTECNQKNNDDDGKESRILTALYYLTDNDWSQKNDGGCLRVFHNGGCSTHFDICPYPNRLAIFRSDRVEHQVLPSQRRDRMALTVWFYGKVKKSLARPQPRSPATLLPFASHVSLPPADDLPPPLPVPSTINKEEDSATIFVSIASFRDSETGPTIQSLFETARFPGRVRVGLVLQVDAEEDQEIVRSIPEKNVRVLALHARDAQGPCYARYLCQSLWRGEDYVLQIDSHMRFRPNWDVYLIETLPSGKSMLSTYPVGYRLPNNIPNETRGTLLVPWKYHQDMLRQRGRLLCKNEEEDDKPIPCRLYAAGFNFSRSGSLQDCRYPNLPHLFFGEELYMAATLFQAGYQLYAPPQTVVYHLWSRSHRPVSSPPVNETVRAQSLAVVHDTLHRIDRRFWKDLCVDNELQCLLEGAETGGLEPERFATQNDESLEVSQPTKALVQKVSALDDKAQDLIASFLRNMPN